MVRVVLPVHRSVISRVHKCSARVRQNRFSKSEVDTRNSLDVPSPLPSSASVQRDKNRSLTILVELMKADLKRAAALTGMDLKRLMNLSNAMTRKLMDCDERPVGKCADRDQEHHHPRQRESAYS